ncbi:hypothetical protein F5883DRAFT_648835 [Diaporthe sp. PMI_573]|nr:hypothetical protein F5883DRAFT_648835 [Diaporthaceae sp. PMI_573]
MSAGAILEWLEHIPSPITSLQIDQERWACTHGDGIDPRKRFKHDYGYGHGHGGCSNHGDFTNPYNTQWPLNTPPATELGPEAHQTTPIRRQKRRGDDLDLRGS